MHNISSETAASLRRWRTEDAETNREQLARLIAHLPVAVREELTDRQRQVLTMHFYEEKTVCQIARELHLNPSTVSRTLQRATQRLYRILRYTV